MFERKKDVNLPKMGIGGILELVKGIYAMSDKIWEAGENRMQRDQYGNIIDSKSNKIAATRAGFLAPGFGGIKAIQDDRLGKKAKGKLALASFINPVKYGEIYNEELGKYADRERNRIQTEEGLRETLGRQSFNIPTFAFGGGIDNPPAKIPYETFKEQYLNKQKQEADIRIKEIMSRANTENIPQSQIDNMLNNYRKSVVTDLNEEKMLDNYKLFLLKQASKNLSSFAMGGEIGDMSEDVMKVDNIEGFKHEQGGTNIGGNAEAEKGETKIENYIFSDRLKIDKKDIKMYNIPKNFIGKTFADISKSVERKLNKREGDPADSKLKEQRLKELMNLQEDKKSMMLLDYVGNNLLPRMAYGGGIGEPPTDGGLQEFIKLVGKLGLDTELKNISSDNKLKGLLNDSNTADETLLNEVTILGEKQYGGSNYKGLRTDAKNIHLKASNSLPGIERFNSNKSSFKNENGVLSSDDDKKAQSPEEKEDKINYSDILYQMGNIYDIARGIDEMSRKDTKLAKIKNALIEPQFLDPTSALEDIRSSMRGYSSNIDDNSSGSVNIASKIALADLESKNISRLRTTYDQSNIEIANNANQINTQNILTVDQLNALTDEREKQLNEMRKDVASNMVQKGLSNAAEILASRNRDIKADRVQEDIIKSMGSVFKYKDDFTITVADEQGQEKEVTVKSIQKEEGVDYNMAMSIFKKIITKLKR